MSVNDPSKLCQPQLFTLYHRDKLFSRQRERPVTARKTGLRVECGVILAKFLFLPPE